MNNREGRRQRRLLLEQLEDRRLLARVFAPQVIISTAADRPTDVLAIDLDGDGDQDVVSGSADDDKVIWYENDGSQGFTSHTVTADANTVRGIFAVDLDGDGDVDLLSASYNDDKIAWYENDGEESFSPHVISTSAASAVTVFAVDLDEDGDMDVLSASYDDDKLAWYENNGSQQFTEHVISDSQAGTLSLYPVDLDGDGDLDLVATAAGESQVNWFQNDGEENFTERLVASDENGASSVVAADLDGDDDVDILASLYDQSLVVWYENDGQQAFSRHTVSDAAWGSYSVIATDLDGDGDLDVASASHNDDKVAWYENDGSGGFTTVDITTSADGAFAVHAADLDGDGDQDLLSASMRDDKIAWYPNNSPPTMDALADLTLAEDDPEQTVQLLGISAGADEDQVLAVSAESDNPDLVSQLTVSYTSAAATGSLALALVADAHGTATITVTVSDGGHDGNLATIDDNATTSRTFLVTVTPVNDLPTIDAISNPTAIFEGAWQQVVTFSGVGAGGGESQALEVIATSSNTTLIGSLSVVYTSAEASGSIRYQPESGVSGTTVITVRVTDAGLDGSLSNAEDNAFREVTFTVNVYARSLIDISAAPILQWFEASYDTMEDRMADAFLAGYGAVWMPPPSRGDTGDQTVGYDVYDRFDLGEAGRPTLYGTETGLRVLADTMHRAGVDLHVDFVMNHNGYSTISTEGFYDAGGYPGLAIKLDNDEDGDFHSAFWGGAEYERLAGLIDIAQEKNHLFIRNPVDPADSQNIRPGTTPAFGRLANVPDADNRRFYPDVGHNTIYLFDPVTGEGDIPVHQFNLEDPMAGDATVENAMGYLMRNAQWLVQVVGVDGLRIDAAKHMQGFALDYLDRAIYRQNPRALLDGSTKHVFTYSEVYDANPGVLHPHVKKNIDPADPGRIGGNRDTLDFKLYFALKENLEYGTQPGWTNWDSNRYAWYQIKDAALDTSPHGGQGDTLHNGNAGVTFVQSHDVHKPFQLDNVAHAYTLMMPGNTVVYFNGKEFGDEREFPKDGRGDALSVADGSDLTRIVSARNTHGRGNYAERWVDDQGLYAFERVSSSLVLLSNRSDSGFDSRTLEHVGFAPGTYLVELTGNAADAARDPLDDIPEVIQVFEDGGVNKVNVRFPRNMNANGDWTGSGYVIYGLPTPQAPAGLELLNVQSVMAGDGSPGSDFENGIQRQTDIHVVTADHLDVRLQTVEVNLLGSLRDEWADGDHALLKLDGGRAINTLNPGGSASGVDFFQPGTVSYGFEQFQQKSSPWIGPGGLEDATWEGDGEFLQTIDLTGLEEGVHYLEARAFRHRTDGGPEVYSSFKEVFYVDRLPPESAVDSFLPWDSEIQENRDLVVRSLDKTADSVHVFLNLPAGTSDSEIMAMVGNGEGAASEYDRDLFKFGYFDVPHGNNVATIVSFEQTGNSSIQRVPGLFTSTIIGAGLGDLDHDGDYDVDDVNRFGEIYRSGQDQFDAAGDFTADGLTTYADLLAMIARFKEIEADVVTVAAAEDLLAEFFAATDDAFGTDEDSALVVQAPGILGNDLDPGMEGSLNLETTGEVETALGGTATFEANGRLHYEPPESQQALASGASIKDSVNYTVSDGLGTTSTATVEITISGVNDAPVAVADVLTVAEGGTATTLAGDVASVLANDTDVDSSDLAAVLVDGPANGSLTLSANGTFSYVHDGSETISDSLTYKVSDGELESGVVTVAITVTPVNDPPVVSRPDDQEHSEGQDVSLQIVASDAEGQDLGYSASGLPGGLGIHSSSGLISGMVDFDAGGASPNTVTVTVTDGGDSSRVDFDWTVLDVPRAPLAVADALTVSEGGGCCFGQLLPDPGAPNGLIAGFWTDLDPGAGGDIQVKTMGEEGDRRFVVWYDQVHRYGGTNEAAANFQVVIFEETNGFEIRIGEVSSGGGLATIGYENHDGTDGLTLLHGDGIALQDTSYHFTAGDAFGDTWDGGGPIGSSNLENLDNGVFLELGDDELSDPVDIGFSFNYFGEAYTQVRVSSNGFVSMGSDSAEGPNLLGNDSDPDGDPLTAVQVTDPGRGAGGVKANGVPDYRHDGSETTSDSFTYKVNDGGLDSNVVTVAVTVIPVNDAPVAVADVLTVAEGGTSTTLAGDVTSVLANDTDVDSSDLAAVLVDGPSHGSLTLNANGTFSYLHDGSETTSDSFTYNAHDGELDSNVATVAITVTPVNDAPVAVADVLTVAEGAEVDAASVLANDIDAEGSDLTAVLVSGVSNGNLVFDRDGTYRYTHDGSETTSDSFTYRASDGELDSGVVIVAITVTPVNDAPVAVADVLTVAEGGTATTLAGDVASVLANDTDVDSSDLAAVLVDGPANGSLTLSANGTFNYVHDGSETTSDSFTYKARDGELDSGVVIVAITVTPVNDAPVAVADVLTVAEGGTATTLAGDVASVLANDTDADSSDLAAALVDGPSHGSLTLNANGTFSYIHDGSETSSDSFTYNAHDGELDSNVATVAITVTPVNDAPVVSDGVFEPTENVLFVRDAAGGLSTLVHDADGDELTFTLVRPARHGELVLAAEGSFSYTADVNFNRTDDFTFTVSDGTVDSEVHTVTLAMQTNFPGHNGALWGDVNDDGRVNVADAMAVVRIVLGSEHAALPADESLRPIRAPFYDTNRDGEISAEDFDVLKDHINLTQSPVGRVRVVPTDDGGKLLRQVQVGENYWLSVLVMDVRLDARGVFASYVKIHYDKDTVQVTGDPLFVSPYETSPHFDRSSAGLVDEVGAAASLDELGADEYVQFRLPMKATAEGLGSFSLSLAQESPDHDFLVFGWGYPVAARQVNLGTSTLLVQPSSGGEGEAAPELYACAAPAPLPLPAAAARPSLFDWVSDRSGSLLGYRQAVDDAMRTVVQQPAPLLERSTVQRIDGLEHGEEEADMLDEILVDEVFSGTGLPGA